MKRTWHAVNRWQTVNVVTGELCKLWRKQYLRLAITIKALRQAFTVCQRAWLADCELRTEVRLCVCNAPQSKSAIARLNR
jgi:hypothetical protein